MPHHTGCTFCDLIHGAAEVSICHEDADAIAFMDIQPVNNGHVLVVPRQHYESLLDVPPDLALHLFRITMQIAAAVRQVAGSADMNIVVNSGAAAGQDEPHYHVHIIPRRQGDGFDIPLPFGGSEMPDRTVLDAYAARVISALRDPVRTRAVVDEPHDRSVALPIFRESEKMKAPPSGERRSRARPAFRAGDANRPLLDSAREGPHGELLYDSASNQGDAA